MDSRDSRDSRPSRIVIIGVGNPSRGDDAAGVLVARDVAGRLAERPAAAASTVEASTVEVLERSGEATGLMSAWAGAGAALLIDAVVSGAEPGTVHCLDAVTEPIPGSFLRCSTHTFGVADAIELGRVLDQLPPRLMVYGVEGRDFGHGAGLSAEVEGALAGVADRVLADIAAILQE